MSGLILDLTRLLPGPLAAKILADMGYTVRRLLPPAGDLLASILPEAYHWLNAGKQEETVDLKSDAGRERLLGLVADAAVLLETNLPGAMERLGVGPNVLRSINPHLTYVRIAGYREEAYHRTPGHDLAYLAADGLLPRIGDSWHHVQLADTTGAMWAVVAAQQGMLQGGGFYEVYLAEAARVLAYPALPALDGSVVCYALYPAADGQIALTALEPHLWTRFCTAIERPDWITEQFTPASADSAVWRDLCDLFRSRPAAAWDEWAQSANVPLRAVQPHTIPDRIVPWQTINDV